MRGREAFRIALEALRANRLRSALTMLGVVIGVAAVVILVAIGSGAKQINLAKGLPSITDTTTLDASTQPGYAGKPLITLNGAGAGTADGLRITGSGVHVRGLVINGFSGSGMLVLGKGGREEEVVSLVEKLRGVSGVREVDSALTNGSGETTP